MNRILLLTVSICLLSGCEQFLSSDKLIRTPSLDLSSLSAIRDYTINHISYTSDDEDHWQAPQETIDKGSGDCEDYCIFVGYYARKLGYDVYVVAIATAKGCHMIVRLNGIDYEARGLYRYYPHKGDTMIAMYSIENALRMCALVYGSRTVEQE